MPTGFSTERAAEYMVLHNLYTIIKEKYPLFYPFYYQKNRDDTQLSFENIIDELHLITLLARRSKTFSPNSTYSAITFRPSLFEHTNYFSTFGITTIVGAPTGTSVDKICFGSKCCWFQLFPSYDENYFTYELIEGKPHTVPPPNISVLDYNSLLEILCQSPKFSWREVLSIVRGWNDMYKKTHLRTLFNYFPRQKPVFIVYK